MTGLAPVLDYPRPDDILTADPLGQTDREQLDRATLERRHAGNRKRGLEGFPGGIRQPPAPDPMADWVHRELAVSWRERRSRLAR